MEFIVIFSVPLIIIFGVAYLIVYLPELENTESPEERFEQAVEKPIPRCIMCGGRVGQSQSKHYKEPCHEWCETYY